MAMVNYMDFKGKVAYIIGGAGTIGGGIAGAFAAGGADIALGDIREDWMDETAERLERDYGVTVRKYVADITKPDTLYEAADKVYQDFGKIDIFSQVASPSASSAGDKGPFYGVPMSAAHLLVEADLLGTGHACKAVLKYMLPAKSGRILIVSSQTARYGIDEFVWYGAAKAGLIHLTQSIARSHAKEGITCNAICPGVVISNLLRTRFEVFAKESGKSVEQVEAEFVESMHIPQGCTQSPEDMGYAAAFLCSDLAKHITGQSLNVCGGMKVN